MAFPRRFKKELWYVRLPSGEIEIVTAAELQRSFECGLVDYRTPVRAFGAHTWSTMVEAAELEVPFSPSSLAPLAVDPPAADLDDDTIWRSRKDIDPDRFKPSKAPFVVAFFGAAAVAMAVIFGGKVSQGVSRERHVTSSTRAAAPVVVVKPTPAPIREMLRTPKFGASRFSKEERHRLLELDYVTRISKPKQMSRTPVTPPKKSLPSDPFAHGAGHGDPLDGTL